MCTCSRSCADRNSFMEGCGKCSFSIINFILSAKLSSNSSSDIGGRMRPLWLRGPDPICGDWLSYSPLKFICMPVSLLHI